MEIIKKYLNELRSIDGIGNSQTESLKRFFSNNKNLEIVFKINQTYLNVENYEVFK